MNSEVIEVRSISGLSVPRAVIAVGAPPRTDVRNGVCSELFAGEPGIFGQLVAGAELVLGSVLELGSLVAR